MAEYFENGTWTRVGDLVSPNLGSAAVQIEGKLRSKDVLILKCSMNWNSSVADTILYCGGEDANNPAQMRLFRDE